MKHDERFAVRCRECGGVIAVREGNTVTSTLRHRARKKEVRVELITGQKLNIICDKCGRNNELTGA